MERKWTERQLEAINKRGDLLVSAAAGAGKTAVLTERIARLISEGTGVDELLVVTFTKAAAAEMKQRISARLLELSEDASDKGDPEKAERLRRASAACAGANISTIHSFCMNVLRRNYHEAGVDPAVHAAETLDSELLASKAIGDVLEAQYLADEKQEDVGFNELLTTAGSDERVEDLIRSLYKYAAAKPNPDEWLDRAVSLYTEGFRSAAVTAAGELMDAVCLELQVFMDRIKLLRIETSEHPGITKALDDDMSFIMGLMLTRDHDKWVRALSGRKFTRLLWNTGTDASEKTGVQLCREALKKYVGTLEKRFSHTLDEEEAFSKLLARPVAALRRLTGEFAKRYSELKAEEGLIDFSDMEQLTLKVLRNESIAREYRERFKYVFIDEYQDINPAQEAILRAVSDNNRFMVGDVKQSIYRFRQAEPAIFLDKYNNYSGEDGRFRIDLNCNFRSRTAVLDAANMLFSCLMRGGAVGEIDYSDNAALTSGFEKREGDPDGSVEITLIDPESFGDEGLDEDSGEELEGSARIQAAYAASRILSIMNNEVLHDKNGPRRYRWSDFTILLRSASVTARDWLQVLSDSGIPCVSDQGQGFFESLEVRLFIDLLRLIDNRRQDIPLLAVMRSFAFGFTEEELIHVKTDYEGDDVLDRVIKAAEDAAAPSWSVKSRRLLDSIERWRTLSRITEIGALISRIIDETGFEVFVSALKGGDARVRNIETLLDLANRFSAAGRGSLGSFIRYLDDSRESAEPASGPAPAVDAVRLMTIHHSKGLEFPVVILGDITRGFNRNFRSDVGIFDSDLGIGLCSVSGDRSNKALLQRAITFREERRQNAEEMRVLYVAQTRAMEKLIMIGAKAKALNFASKLACPPDGVRIMNASCYADWMLGAYFPNGVDSPAVFPHGGSMKLEIRGAGAAMREGRGLTPDAFASWQQEASFADPDELCERFKFKYRAEEDTKLPSKLSVTGLTLTAPQVRLRPRFMENERDLTGAEIGTLTHKLLQLVSVAPHTESTVEAELEALIERGVFTGREAKAIRIPAIVAFFDSPLGKRLIASDTVLREKEFELFMEASVLTGAPTDAPIMLQGVIDCCFIEDGGWVLVDHKTTHVDASHTARTVAERYRSQLDLYSKALTRLTGLPVKERYVYLLSVNEAVKL